MATISGKSLVLLLLLPLLRTVIGGFHVTTLPGFPGDLPFYMETGYVSVGNVEYFYYFVKSQSNPAVNPLLLFTNGGPGCSALNGFFFEIGFTEGHVQFRNTNFTSNFRMDPPLYALHSTYKRNIKNSKQIIILGPLQFKTENYTGGIPTLVVDPYAWTNIANVIFLDAPVGTGFTYATTTAAWRTTDTLSAQDLHIFSRKWLQEHPDFLANPFYVATDSFMGILNPIVAQDIINGNEAGLLPFVNIKGLSLSCAHTHSSLETDTRIILAHRLALISDELYEAANISCGGNYYDPPNMQCKEDIESITECTNLINLEHMLLPLCATLTPKPNKEDARRSLVEKSKNFLAIAPVYGDFWCKNYEYLLADVWANAEPSRNALGIRNGTVDKWERCNITLNGYEKVVHNAVPYHKNLTTTGLQLLVFSGDHDMVVPHLALEQWIKSLGLTVDLAWRPWFVDGQVAGYTVKYTNDGYRLTYATVKGSGHSPPEYKPKECYEMFSRWIHYYPI